MGLNLGVALGGMFSTLLGGVVGAVGAGQQAVAARNMYDYQAGMAMLNARIAKQNADWAIYQGALQARQYGLQAGQQLGHIETAQAASGLDVHSGSAAQVQKSQQMLTNLDLNQIRTNAAKTAYNYDAQAIGFEQQANLYMMAGANAAAAGPLNMASSILGSAASVSSEWLQYNQLSTQSGGLLGG